VYTIDFTGQVFSRLKVLKYAGQNAHRDSMWKCVCSCGKKRTVCGGDLKNGHTKSCGCLQAEIASANGKANPSTTHGQSYSPEYTSWQMMKQRCTNANYSDWHRYGGRGIKVCTRWLNSFEAFLKDMGRRTKGKTLDRINPNGHYVPSNGRWATATTQGRNRRNRYRLVDEPVLVFVDVK